MYIYAKTWSCMTKQKLRLHKGNVLCNMYVMQSTSCTSICRCQSQSCQLTVYDNLCGHKANVRSVNARKSQLHSLTKLISHPINTVQCPTFEIVFLLLEFVYVIILMKITLSSINGYGVVWSEGSDVSYNVLPFYHRIANGSYGRNTI